MQHRFLTIMLNLMHLLSNACFPALLEAMSAHQTSTGSLLEGIVHFLKVTASYWSGLFHCYSVPGLPRTNNHLEHIFGTVRYHHRRCTGRKVAPVTLVLRGSVQLIACVATQLTTEACWTVSYCISKWLAFFTFPDRTTSYQSGRTTTFSTFSCWLPC